MALSFANKITMCRILAVPFFITAILYYLPQREYLRYVALSIFLLAIITDVIDGYIARVHHQKTQAGAILDPLADKLLLMSAFICLYKVGGLMGEIYFPLWFILIMISRDVILLLGSMLIYLSQGDLQIDPSKWGKITTFWQVLCVIGVLLQWPFSLALWMAAVAFTVISGLGYIHKGIRVLNVSSD